LGTVGQQRPSLKGRATKLSAASLAMARVPDIHPMTPVLTPQQQAQKNDSTHLPQVPHAHRHQQVDLVTYAALQVTVLRAVIALQVSNQGLYRCRHRLHFLSRW